MSKIRTRWQEQFRTFRRDGHTARCPMIATSGYLSQRRDVLAMRDEMFARIDSADGRRGNVVRNTLKYFR